MIPTCNRPATLYITLEYLKKVRGIKDYHVVFAIDKYNANETVIGLVDEFKGWHGNVYILARMIPYGLTRNILEGYKYCFKKSDDYVIIVEDDIRLSADFLEYCEYCFKNFVSEKTFGITGYTKDGLEPDVRKIYRKVHYFSLGTLILKPMFEKWVLPHCKDEYYYNCSSYLVKHFPGLMVNNGMATHYQQAGTINRVLKQNRFHLISPYVPRAQHFGVSGGNRKSDIERLPWMDQVKAIKRAIDNPEELARLERTNYKDYISIKDNHEWSDLYE